jgi:hypothetical protein
VGSVTIDADAHIPASDPLKCPHAGPTLRSSARAADERPGEADQHSITQRLYLRQRCRNIRAIAVSTIHDSTSS